MRGIKGLLTLVGALSVFATSSPAAAQTFRGGAGIFIGLRVGAKEPAFEWGGELFATHLFQGGVGCTTVNKTGMGALFQFAVAGLSDPRLTLAAHAGGELSNDSIPVPTLDGELGVAIFPERSRAALHLGALVEVSPLFNVGVRHHLFQKSTSINLGFRYLPTFGMPEWCIED